ncbi:hypothetical protein K491DRAFT_477752 [Lophiostoma macrostomum CBS 122681]|uniref:Uncharacterized protein n=1 Tax=Lophiostoma macrostomum CBS 122681 TaxID=1314788 RepID=A0A6A6TN12_9PLEO|nr:hypothetical protein K491DRAFT_477752 [Lophiostoma macrostomum CBS 122681]
MPDCYNCVAYGWQCSGYRAGYSCVHCVNGRTDCKLAPQAGSSMQFLDSTPESEAADAAKQAKDAADAAAAKKKEEADRAAAEKKEKEEEAARNQRQAYYKANPATYMHGATGSSAAGQQPGTYQYAQTGNQQLRYKY